MTLKLTFAPLSDVGRERSENQDAYGSQHLADLDFYIVCDGMGGHRGGSTAARLGVATIEQVLAERVDLAPTERMVEALRVANDAIHRKANRDRELRGMGTTAVVLAIDHKAGRAHYAHVGDSRIYLLRDGCVRQLTRDHTFVQRLVDDGILTPEAAEDHPQSNVIIRSLGGQESVEVEVGETEIVPVQSDLFVLCSDGLHGLVSEPRIADIAHQGTLEEAAKALIDAANDKGGHDNITVELILVGERAEPPAAWTIARPSPAPGTRLAKQAQEADARTTAKIRIEESNGGPALPSSDRAAPSRPSRTAPTTAINALPITEPVPKDPAEQSTDRVPVIEGGSKTGVFVLVGVVVGILLAAALLFLVFKSSPSAHSISAPQGTLPGESAPDGSGAQ